MKCALIAVAYPDPPGSPFEVWMGDGLHGGTFVASYATVAEADRVCITLAMSLRVRVMPLGPALAGCKVPPECLPLKAKANG